MYLGVSVTPGPTGEASVVLAGLRTLPLRQPLVHLGGGQVTSHPGCAKPGGGARVRVGGSCSE